MLSQSSSLACSSQMSFQTELEILCFQAGDRCHGSKADCLGLSSHMSPQALFLKFPVALINGIGHLHVQSQLRLLLFPALLILFSCCFQTLFRHRSSVEILEEFFFLITSVCLLDRLFLFFFGLVLHDVYDLNRTSFLLI